MTNAAGNSQFIRVPRSFLEETTGQISAVDEMQVMLAFFRVADERGLDAPVAERELLDDRPLNDALRLEGTTREPSARIHRGIELAIARSSLLAFTVRYDGDAGNEAPGRWLIYGTPENQVRLQRFRTGALSLPSIARPELGRPAIEQDRPGVFQLYEQNIGLVTPIIADRLVEALELYPESWISDAITASVTYNRRSWRYIQRILETWATEGRTNEADRRSQSSGGTVDLERDLQGKYAAIFRRQRRE